jgi:hypothetical protein
MNKPKVHINVLPWLGAFGLSFFVPLWATWILIFFVVCDMSNRLINEVRNENRF